MSFLLLTPLRRVNFSDFEECHFLFQASILVISFLLQFYLGGNLFLFWFVSTNFSAPPYVLPSSLRRF